MTDGHTVLVVEDEADIREMLTLLLEGEGYAVHQAEDGLRAVAVLEELIPDLVLLDIMMPGMDGHAVCRHVRAPKGTATLWADTAVELLESL